MDKGMIKDGQVSGIMIFVTFLYGINPMVVKMGILAMPQMLFTTYRLFIAMIAFIGFLLWSNSYKKVESRDWLMFLFMGFLAFVFQIAMIFSLHYVSAATVATMIGIMPISVLFIHTRMHLGKVYRHHFIGALVAFVGVFLISGMASQSSSQILSQTFVGLGLLFIGQFAAAGYTVASEKALEKYSHYQVSTLMYSIAFVIMFPFSIPEMVSFEISSIKTQAILCIIYGGIVSLCIANNLWIWGIQKIGSHKAAIYNNLPPVFAIIGGVVFLDEIPTVGQVIGIGVVLFGLYIFRKDKKKSEEGKEIEENMV